MVQYDHAESNSLKEDTRYLNAPPSPYQFTANLEGDWYDYNHRIQSSSYSNVKSNGLNFFLNCLVISVSSSLARLQAFQSTRSAMSSSLG